MCEPSRTLWCSPVLDFLKFASKHRIPYLTQGHHHTHHGWAQTHCPQCTDGTRGWHLGFSLERGNFNCWRCGSVRAVDAVMGLLRVSKEKAHELLREFGGGRADGRRAVVVRKRKIKAPLGLAPLAGCHRRYLKARGLDPDAVAEEWELQGSRFEDPKWAWRVVAPIRNLGGEVVAYVGRSIHNEAKPKYRVTDDADCLEDPKALVYGIHKVPDKAVIVVEGPADVWNMGPGAVATLGVDWTVARANKLRRFQRRFVMFDPEPLAQERAEKLAEWLGSFPGETEVVSGLPSDPGSLSRKLVRKLRKSLLGV